MNNVYFTFDEYMMWYSKFNIPIPDDVIRKMIVDVNPFSSVCDGTFEWYRNYFETFKQDVQKRGKVLKIVAKRVDD